MTKEEFFESIIEFNFTPNINLDKLAGQVWDLIERIEKLEEIKND